MAGIPVEEMTLDPNHQNEGYDDVRRVNEARGAAYDFLKNVS